MMQHTKYNRSGPLTFQQEDFKMLSLKNQYEVDENSLPTFFSCTQLI